MSIVIDEVCLKEKLKKLKADAHKGTNGTLCAVVGSEKYRGAADLCIGGALRTGVGIVRLISCESVVQTVASRHPSCTFLPTEPKNLPAAIYSQKDDCFAIGCGIGASTESSAAVFAVLSKAEKAVIDADALNIISLNPEQKNLLCGHIITPHVGEFSRLTGLSAEEIKSSPEKYALEFSERYGCVTVLKDAKTVVSSPTGYVYVSEAASCGLSKGGSGDVLTGIIGGFLAQGYSPLDSAVIGVAVHALASRICEEKYGCRSMLPSDIESGICELFARLGF